MPRVIQGRWDDVVKNHDLRGHQVRVIVVDEDQADAASDNPWLRSLRAWADSHGPWGNSVDDSREGIYSGTIDDPR
jgi:hypothetical protein